MTEIDFIPILERELRRHGLAFDRRDLFEWSKAILPLCHDDAAALCQARAFVAALAGAAEQG
jgi:hypothetical protein